MTIQYMSDLHLEFTSNLEFLSRLPWKATGDVLVLAGDSLYLGGREMPSDDHRKLRDKFFRWASDNYKEVLLVPGNHEYYGGYDMKAEGEAWAHKLLPNVGYYNNKVVTIGDTDFIITTLWSHIPEERRDATAYFLNDFHRIQYEGHTLTVDDFNREHDRCVAFIREAVAQSKARHRVVVTHHVPTPRCTPMKFKLIRDGKLESAFVADLTDYILKAPIDYWIYGHSHANIDADVGGTKVVTNQLGYVFRKEYMQGEFDFNKKIQLS